MFQKISTHVMKKKIYLGYQLKKPKNCCLIISILTNLSRFVQILKIIANLNIPIIDLHEEVFKLEKDPISLFPYRKNRHYNKDGFDKSSKAIVNNIN